MFLQLSARLRDKLTPPLPSTTIRESAINFEPVSIVESVSISEPILEPEPVVEPEPIVPPQKSCSRPAFHQLHLFDWTACEEPLKWIEQLLTELKEKINEEDSHLWQVEWESKKEHQLERHRRHSLIRSESFYALAEQPTMKVAFFAYQDGTALLLHTICYLGGEVQEDTFTDEFRALLYSSIPRDTKGYLGEARLLSLLIKEYSAHEQRLLAQQLADRFLNQESQLEALSLTLPTDATFYTQSSGLFDNSIPGGILLYHDSNAEATIEADHFISVTWPMLLFYQQMIKEDYLNEYVNKLETRLKQANQQLTQTLEQHGQAKTWHSLKKAQRELNILSTVQQIHLDTLTETEQLLHGLSMNLKHLKQLLQRAPLLQNHPQQSLFTHQAQQYHDQLDHDMQNARLTLSRTNSTIELLDTYAGIMQARYERWLTLMIGVLGIAFLVGQLVEERGATYLYALLYFDRWLPYIPYLNYPTPDTDPFVFAFRLLLTLLAAFVAWVVMSIWQWRWGYPT